MRTTGLRRFATFTAFGLGAIAALVAVLLTVNGAPRVPALSTAEAQAPGAPYVVKLHARWCSLCMATKGVWVTIAETYAGRVRFAVFDFTNEETTRASEAEARRIGLGSVFDEYAGATGTILVLNGASREVIGDLHGERDFEPYRAAIDKALLAPR